MEEFAFQSDFRFELTGEDTCELARYNGRAPHVVIPSLYDGRTVTAIHREAFAHYDNLISVVIPDCVSELGEEAFRWCRSLETVSIGNGVREIGIRTFYGCGKLKNVTIGRGVKYIGMHAFYSAAMETLALPEGLTEIDRTAFFGCKRLTDLVIPHSVTRIADSAFAMCRSLTHAVFHETGGWSAVDGETVLPIPPQELSDPQKAAEHLKRALALRRAQ